MRIGDFDFTLPPELVALRPAEPRGSARLLVVRPDGNLEHCLFRDLPSLLRIGDVLSFNDSRVISARLTGTRRARNLGFDVAVGITLHKRLSSGSYRGFAQPARRLRPGDHLTFRDGLTAQVTQRAGAEVDLRFNQEGTVLDTAIASIGDMPLPPYIAGRRAPDDRDRQDYQTVYADRDGSVAAPTAGLHFTTDMLGRLAVAGIACAPVTLHVGAGTFLPVTALDIEHHHIHAERAQVSEETARALNRAHLAGGRVVAVGTTTLRTLESAATPDGLVQPFHGDTDIFIIPGYSFRAVDVLLTNFHLPRSTLFMLVSAFMSLDVMRRAYCEAIRRQYRFYSYGDACLLLRRP